MNALRLLVLEDKKFDAELTSIELNKRGLAHTYRRVDTEDDFRRELAVGTYDIILSDYALPSFDGLAALAIAREQKPDVPFIFVTGALGEERAIRTLQEGATDYVLKNSLERLAPSICRAIKEQKERDDLRQAELALKERERRTQERIAALNRELEQKVDERTRQLEESQRALLQAQKLEAIGQLAGGIAHDFNNIVAGILGICDELLQRHRNDETSRDDINEIVKAGHRAMAVTKRLLTFGRRQIIQPAVVQVNEVIRDFHRMLERFLGEDVKIRLDLADTLPIRVDRSGLEQILMNLTINSRDAMPAGGTVVITTHNVELQGKNPSRRLDAAPGRYVLLSVKDSGEGMTLETQAHLFEPFYTTKDKFKGTGLGLATVHGIMRQSHGDIEVLSTQGLGTEFRLYFPALVESAVPAEPLRMPTVSAGAAGTESVLVVEDEEIVRRTVVRLLKQQGYTVIEASTGEEALERAASCLSPLRLLVTDVIMPGMNGKELGERLRYQFPDLLVLYMSGYPEDVLSFKGTLKPGIAFLDKSELLQQLTYRVRRLLDARLAPSERPSS